MSTDLNGTSATAAVQDGNGAQVQIIWQADALKPYAYAFLIVIVFNVLLSGAALFMCLAAAPSLLAKSEYMSEKLENNTRYEIQVQYWMQRVEVMAEKQGLKLPPPPSQQKE